MGPTTRLIELCCQIDAKKKESDEPKLTELRIASGEQIKWSAFVNDIKCACPYEYGTGENKKKLEAQQMPAEIKLMAKNIVKNLELSTNPPTHATINLYTQGAQLGPHSDDEPIMNGGKQPTMIISESRGFPYVMTFKSKKHFTNWRTGQVFYDYESLVLPDRSILIMQNGDTTLVFTVFSPQFSKKA